MRRLCGELVTELTLPVPARPADLYAALCEAMSRRRGRPVLFRTAAFPAGTASGLWLDMADQDLVVSGEVAVLVGLGCGLAYPVRDTLPVLLVDEARKPGS